MQRSDSMRLLALASILSLVVAVPAFAQSNGTSRMSGLKLSGDQPIQIESDKLEVRELESVAIFTGNVNVVQGPTLLKAGKMTVHYVKQQEGSSTSASPASQDIERLEVEDKVYLKSEDQVATGDAGTFDVKSDTLTLTGKEVVLTDGGNVAKGCKLTVNTRTGLSKLDSCAGGRVQVVLQPGSQGE